MQTLTQDEIFLRFYAKERALHTKQPYLITDDGHVMADSPLNRKTIREIGAKIVARITARGTL